MKETLQNSEVNDKVIKAQNINVEMIKSGKITALENIGKYFQNIERFEKNLQTKIFIKNVDPSVIILLGGKEKIKDLTLEEIKEKVFNQTQDISTMEIITELNKDSWKGNDPIIFKKYLLNKYNIFNNYKRLEIKFDTVLRNCITGKMKQEMQETISDMMKHDVNKTMEIIIKNYNEKGKYYFFSEPEPSKTIISRVCQENKVRDKEHDILRKKRCVIFGLKNDGDDYKVMAEILENMEISDVNIKRVYRVQCKQEIKPLKVEFCSVEEKKIFWRKYLQQKDEYIFDVKPDHSLRYRIRYKLLKDTMRRLTRNLVNREEMYVIRNMKIVKKRL